MSDPQRHGAGRQGTRLEQGPAGEVGATGALATSPGVDERGAGPRRRRCRRGTGASRAARHRRRAGRRSAPPAPTRTPSPVASARVLAARGHERPTITDFRSRTRSSRHKARRPVGRDDDGRRRRCAEAVGEDAGDEGDQEEAEEGEVGTPAGAAGQCPPHRHGALTSPGSTACAGGTGTAGRGRNRRSAWTTAATIDHASSIARRRTNTPEGTPLRPRRTVVRFRIAGQVRGQRGELVEVDGHMCPDDPLVELFDGQPPLAEVLAELLDDPLSVLVPARIRGWRSPMACASSRSVPPWCAEHVSVGLGAEGRPGPTSDFQRRKRDDWCPDPPRGRRPSATPGPTAADPGGSPPARRRG